MSTRQLILEKILFQFLIPAIIAIVLAYFVEKRSRVIPPRDQKEVIGRLVTAVMALIVFGVLQALVRFTNITLPFLHTGFIP